MHAGWERVGCDFAGARCVVGHCWNFPKDASRGCSPRDYTSKHVLHKIKDRMFSDRYPLISREQHCIRYDSGLLGIVARDCGTGLTCTVTHRPRKSGWESN